MSIFTRYMMRMGKSQFSQLQQFDKSNKRAIKESLGERVSPIPKSPVLGPITIDNPTVSNKKYRWCSCGMSKTQPICDDSHVGTQFKPYRFTIEQQCKNIQLCGCKLTTKKPFCDGLTCVELNNIP